MAYSPWVLGRHPDYWADPLSFKPDRWLGSEHNGGKPVPIVGTLPFIPFNYGPRTCLGIKMVPTTPHAHAPHTQWHTHHHTYATSV